MWIFHRLLSTDREVVNCHRVMYSHDKVLLNTNWKKYKWAAAWHFCGRKLAERYEQYKNWEKGFSVSLVNTIYFSFSFSPMLKRCLNAESVCSAAIWVKNGPLISDRHEKLRIIKYIKMNMVILRHVSTIFWSWKTVPPVFHEQFKSNSQGLPCHMQNLTVINLWKLLITKTKELTSVTAVSYN